MIIHKQTMNEKKLKRGKKKYIKNVNKNETKISGGIVDGIYCSDASSSDGSSDIEENNDKNEISNDSSHPIIKRRASFSFSSSSWKFKINEIKNEEESDVEIVISPPLNTSIDRNINKYNLISPQSTLNTRTSFSSSLFPYLFWTYKNLNYFNDDEISSIHRLVYPETVKTTDFLSFLKFYSFDELNRDKQGNIVFPKSITNSYSSLLNSFAGVNSVQTSSLFPSSDLFDENICNNHALIPSFDLSYDFILKTSYNYSKISSYVNVNNLSLNQVKAVYKGFFFFFIL
jgi:hypothetical protein